MTGSSVTVITQYEKKITAAWHKTTESILEVANYIFEADEALGDQFRELRQTLEDKGVLSRSTISKLLSIGRDRKLYAKDSIKILPPSYASLYEFTQLTEKEFEAAKSQKLIHSEMQQKDAKALRNPQPHAAKTQLTSLAKIEADIDQLSAGESDPISLDTELA